MRGGLSAGVKSATDQFSASELEEALDLATSFHVLTDEEAAAARARVAAGESSFDREITALESSLEGVLGLKASGAKAQVGLTMLSFTSNCVAIHLLIDL